MNYVRKFLKILILTALFTLVCPVFAYAEDTQCMDSQFLSDINQLRASQGLPALSIDAELTKIAAIRAQEASVVWSHTRPNGTQGIGLISPKKWRGENLAYVQSNDFNLSNESQLAAERLMYANLKASPTHYANMVFGNFTKIGIYTYVLPVDGGTKVTTAFMFSS